MVNWKSEIRKRLAGLGLEPARESEITEELSEHLKDRYEELLSTGASKDEARRITLEELNEAEILTAGLKRIERRAGGEPVEIGSRRANIMGNLWQDIRYGIRMLRKKPVFTLVAVLSLALGIGANTAIFQLLNAVRLRSLPVKAPEELAEVTITDMTGARGSFNSWHPSLTNPVWEQIRDRQDAFSGIFAWGTDFFNLAQGGEVRNARGLWVSGDFFNVLGVQPILGRVFSPADDKRGCAEATAVISYSFWQRELGGSNDVIGKQLRLDDKLVDIIGVTPASFFGLEVGKSFDVALPICSEAIIRGENNRLDAGTSWWLIVVGRLKQGWSMEQATAQLATISPAVFETTLSPNYPSVSVKDYLAFKLMAVPAGSGISQLRESYTTPLWLLLVVAGLVLLIACANLANLMLARASAREREIAIRLALGASRGRLISQLLVESLLLASIGAFVALLLAQVLSQFLVSYISTQGSPFFVDLRMDWSVLGFASGLTVLTCILFGLAPALRATRIDPGAVMKAGSRGLTANRERFGLRRVLVVAQVALSLILVIGAFMFSRSLNKLLTLDVGFHRDGVLIAGVDFSRLNLARDRRQPFKRELLNRIRSIPGVERAATSNIIPLSGDAWGNNAWTDGPDSRQQANTLLSRVSPEYFKTLDIPLLSGRDFDERDSAESIKVAIVNESFARQLFGGANPVGKSFWIEKTPYDPETQYEIIGLVKDTKYEDIRDDFSPIAFLSSYQSPRPSSFDQILIRSNEPIAAAIAATKRAIAEVSPDININFQGLEEQINDLLLKERLMATLSGFFGGLALLLASIGLYGIMSYGVASRTNEIGIRMALGAKPRNVLRMILGEMFMLVLIGVGIGIPAVLLLSSFISKLLFGLSPNDPISIVLASVVMLAVAAVAGYIPARRASRVDPMIALRYE